MAGSEGECQGGVVTRDKHHVTSAAAAWQPSDLRSLTLVMISANDRCNYLMNFKVILEQFTQKSSDMPKYEYP